MLKFLLESFRVDEPLNRVSEKKIKHSDSLELISNRIISGSRHLKYPVKKLKNVWMEHLTELSKQNRQFSRGPKVKRGTCSENTSFFADTHEIVGCMLNSVWRRDESLCTPGEEDKDFEFHTIRKEVAMVAEILNELHESFWSLRPDQDVVLHL